MSQCVEQKERYQTPNLNLKISSHALRKQFYFGPASFGVIFGSKEIPLERA